jgi:hypothetical protein
MLVAGRRLSCGHGPYCFFFFSNEGFEPPHIHVQRERRLAKFWLEPVRPASSTGFAAQELNRMQRLVEENATRFLETWHEYFGN